LPVSFKNIKNKRAICWLAGVWKQPEPEPSFTHQKEQGFLASFVNNHKLEYPHSILINQLKKARMPCVTQRTNH